MYNVVLVPIYSAKTCGILILHLIGSSNINKQSLGYLDYERALDSRTQRQRMTLRKA